MNFREKTALLRELSKSGIVTLVLISVFAGYLLGQSAEVHLSWTRLAATLIGVLFLSSGASALNQYQERHLDAQMARTAGRPLPSGKLSLKAALLFIGGAIALGLATLLKLGASLVALGVAAVLLYNGLYTLWWKKKWSFAAVPGAIPGALPILMGYTAANGAVFTPGGLYLFFILFYWQMPHFWVLALKYREDYAKGGFPTLPVTHGAGVTIAQIIVWCLGYVALALVAPLFLPVGTVYLVVTLAMSLKLVWELRAFARAPESKKWLHFFLWVNFSLIIYLAAATADTWSIHLLPYFIR